mgnify:CR=1 FL=1
MKILVTGGSGFIGTNLIKRLISDGHTVDSLDDYSVGLKSNETDGCNYVSLDIEQIDRMGGDYDLCFHLAGLSRIQPSFDDPMETFRVNTEGTQIVMDWALKNDVKVIYAGSSSKHHNPHQSPYATYKYLGEEICKMYRKVYKLHIDIVRFYNVYGPYEVIDGDWAAVIGIWRRQVRDGEPLTIVGDGEQRRDFTHVDDIVDGLIRVGNLNYYHEDAWELGTGINYSINEVAQMFVEKFDCKLNYIPNQNGNYRETLRESDDSLEKLNWKPKDNLKEYIYSL